MLQAASRECTCACKHDPVKAWRVRMLCIMNDTTLLLQKAGYFQVKRMMLRACHAYMCALKHGPCVHTLLCVCACVGASPMAHHYGSHAFICSHPRCEEGHGVLLRESVCCFRQLVTVLLSGAKPELGRRQSVVAAGTHGRRSAVSDTCFARTAD